MKKLNSLHLRVVRHMTGCHIQKTEGHWEYPDYTNLLFKCGLFPVETLIERCGNVWMTIKKIEGKNEENQPHNENVHNITLWNQKHLSESQMEEIFKIWLKFYINLSSYDYFG